MEWMGRSVESGLPRSVFLSIGSFVYRMGEVVVDRALSFGWSSNRRRVGGESH